MRKVKGEYIFTKKEIKELIYQCYGAGRDNPFKGEAGEKYVRLFIRWQMDCLDKEKIRIEVYEGSSTIP